MVKSDGIDVAKRDARKATHNLLIATRILWGTIIGGKHNLPVKTDISLSVAPHTVWRLVAIKI